jgi:hypothetical protein
MFCSNQLGNSRQMDLFSMGIDVKLKERKKESSLALPTKASILCLDSL